MPKNNPAICQLGREYVEWIHDELIGTLWPDVEPVSGSDYRDLALLESALGRPFHSAGGQDVYPTMLEKAAALFHSLIANHPFQNGNKRTAVVAVDTFLVANGYSLGLQNERAYELAKNTASYKQRGLTSDQAFHEILETLGRWTITFAKLYRAQKKYPRLSRLYKSSVALRRNARKIPANKLIPGQNS